MFFLLQYFCTFAPNTTIMLTTETVSRLFNGFNNLNVMIIGDVMVDSYIWGKVDRISPEAPVPIVKVEKINTTPGGAGNVVLNLLSLKANVKVIGRIGMDYDGKILIDDLKKKGANIENIFCKYWKYVC